MEKKRASEILKKYKTEDVEEIIKRKKLQNKMIEKLISEVNKKNKSNK
jgi:hypothetical protein